jgi:UDP-N-acetylglucosamine--N-acetylmuramyl-(pentapeptide) pyrophosphoryl-undecaprenol N-acetylglucosamine transferase
MNEFPQKDLTIVLAAGGTGGHLFPAQALAEELKKMQARIVLVTDKRFSSYTGQFGDVVEVEYIRAGGLKRGLKMLKSIMDIGIGVVQAFCLLRRLKPQVVVGFGGYPSFPTMYVASALGIRTIIHEQNALLGRANRIIARRVDRIATSFAQTGFINTRDASKIVVTGNPVRAGIRSLRSVPYPERGGDEGGSQGARVFSDVLPAAMAQLPRPLRSKIQIHQQVRAEDMAAVKDAYQALEMPVELAPFFADMPSQLAAAHLVITRSGASTVAELTVAGRPSILVPLPTSADNHQHLNAQAVETAGGGWLMAQQGFTASALAARIEGFIGSPNSLNTAASAAHAIGVPEATERLAQLVLELASQA